MTKRFAVFFTLFFSVASIPALAQDAPFGMSWGQTAAEVEKLTGATRNTELLWGRVIDIDIATVPVTPPRTDFVSFAVDPEFGLARIIWISQNITGDPFGTEGKEQYFQYKELLSKKYGKPKSDVEIAGLDLWDEKDEFYQCLAYSGCGMYSAIWETAEGVSVGLSLRGIERGEGYHTIVYEGPEWSNVIEAVNSEEDAIEEDAF